MAIPSSKQPGKISYFVFYKGKNGGCLTVFLVVTKPKHTPWCVFLTSATASNTDSLICSVIHLATENYVLVQLLSLIINSISGKHNFLQEKNDKKLSKIMKLSRQRAQCMNALLPASSFLRQLFVCYIFAGKANFPDVKHKVLTRQKQLSHCF